MRFTFAIIPAIFLASTVYAQESSVIEESAIKESAIDASVIEAYNIKDMNHRLADMIEQGGYNINSIIEEMGLDMIYPAYEEEDPFAEHGGFEEFDDSKKDEEKGGASSKSLLSEKDFGVITIDLKPYLNLFYNLFKPIDPIELRNKFFDVLFKTFFEPLFDENEHIRDKSVDQLIKDIVKGINPFLGGTLKVGEKKDSV